MQSLYKYTMVALATFLGIGSLNSCSDSGSNSGGNGDVATIERPEISVREVTTTGFIIGWNAVRGAGSYNYSLDGGEEISTTEREIVFGDLENQTEYVVAIKAAPGDALMYKESPYTYIHVRTDDVEQLPKPVVTLGSAYASRTLISWTSVPEAAAYEYTIDGKTLTTPERQVSLKGLASARDYEFSVRALTGDATRFNSSEAAELAFTVSAEDIPAVLISPIETLSDAMAFDIFVGTGVTYFYDVLTASTYEKFTHEELLELYREAILEEAANKGISLKLALASILESGSQQVAQIGLSQELSYEIIAFGMDLEGNLTSDLSHVRVRTTANGESYGPNYGGSEWFNQSFYITNDLIVSGYTWMNSTYTVWKGRDVAEVYYRTISTRALMSVFPDLHDTEAITEFLLEYGMRIAPELVPLINTDTGWNMVTEGAMAGQSYTQLTLAVSTSGERTLCVNSTTTKTSMESAPWFLAFAQKGNPGETHNTFIGGMAGIDVVGCKYAVFTNEDLEGIAASEYAGIVADYGSEVPDVYIAYINGGGYGIRFSGADPSTTYTFITTAVNSVGDTNTKWESVTTDAAPVSASAPAVAKTRASAMYPLVPAPLKAESMDGFIYPMRSIPLSEEMMEQLDPWTIIHNKQILKFKTLINE